MDIGKIPPHDIEAEQAVIGSMLTDRDAVIDAVEILKPDDFYRQDNKTIYEAILNLYGRAEPIDIITVKAELVSLGKFDSIGGLEYLSEVIDSVVSASSIDSYIKIIREKAIRRNLIKTCEKIENSARDESTETNDVIEIAEKDIFMDFELGIVFFLQ